MNCLSNEIDSNPHKWEKCQQNFCPKFDLEKQGGVLWETWTETSDGIFLLACMTISKAQCVGVEFDIPNLWYWIDRH